MFFVHLDCPGSAIAYKGHSYGDTANQEQIRKKKSIPPRIARVRDLTLLRCAFSPERIAFRPDLHP
jgi:hypothetical protein